MLLDLTLLSEKDKEFVFAHEKLHEEFYQRSLIKNKRYNSAEDMMINRSLDILHSRASPQDIEKFKNTNFTDEMINKILTIKKEK